MLSKAVYNYAYSPDVLRNVGIRDPILLGDYWVSFIEPVSFKNKLIKAKKIISTALSIGKTQRNIDYEYDPNIGREYMKIAYDSLDGKIDKETALKEINRLSQEAVNV